MNGEISAYAEKEMVEMKNVDIAIALLFCLEYSTVQAQLAGGYVSPTPNTGYNGYPTAGGYVSPTPNFGQVDDYRRDHNNYVRRERPFAGTLYGLDHGYAGNTYQQPAYGPLRLPYGFNNYNNGFGNGLGDWLFGGSERKARRKELEAYERIELERIRAQNYAIQRQADDNSLISGAVALQAYNGTSFRRATATGSNGSSAMAISMDRGVPLADYRRRNIPIRPTVTHLSEDDIDMSGPVEEVEFDPPPRRRTRRHDLGEWVECEGQVYYVNGTNR